MHVPLLIIAVCAVCFYLLHWQTTWVLNKDGDMKFRAGCMAYTYVMPSSWLHPVIDNPYIPFFIPPEISACAVETLRNRGEISDTDVYFEATGLYLDESNFYFSRPDIKAYFLHSLINDGYDFAYGELAEMYADGVGIPQNLEKAKMLFAQKVFSGFHLNEDKKECDDSIEWRYEYATHPLHIEQLDQIKEICLMPAENIYALAMQYLENGQTQIAETLLWGLYYDLDYEAAQAPLDKIRGN